LAVSILGGPGLRPAAIDRVENIDRFGLWCLTTSDPILLSFSTNFRLPFDNSEFLRRVSILAGMRRASFLFCCVTAVFGAVMYVPIKPSLILRPGETYTLNVDATAPLEIGWRAVQARPCVTQCVQVTEVREGVRHSMATSMGSSQEYRPAGGKISVEYKNVSSEPVTIDVFRIDRTCEAEACRFLDAAQKARTLVFKVGEFQSITTSKDGSYSIIFGVAMSGRSFRVKAVWWTDEKTGFAVNCAPFVKRYLENHTPKEQYRPYVIAGQAIGEGNDIVLKSVDTCAPKADHFGASEQSIFK